MDAIWGIIRKDVPKLKKDISEILEKESGLESECPK
jgi:uncharacterized protein with HEPN domain